MNLPLAYQESIFGTPISHRFSLDPKHAPQPSNRFVAARSLAGMGNYGPAPVGHGVYSLSGLGQANDVSPQVARADICAANCNTQFGGSGREARCYNVCINAPTTSSCQPACDDEFGTRNRKAKCAAACVNSFAVAAGGAPLVFGRGGEGAPNGAPIEAGVFGTVLPVLLVVGAVLGIGLYLRSKGKI